LNAHQATDTIHLTRGQTAVFTEAQNVPLADSTVGTVAPPPAPTGPDEPSNRWPWVALAAGVLVIAVAVIAFFLNRPGGVTITGEGTPTVNPVARANTASPGPPATLVPPTLVASASLGPTATSPPAPTPSPAPTSLPTR